MLKGNKLKLQRGAAAKTEDEDRNNDGENRHHAVTVRLACENLQCFSGLWILSKDRTQVEFFGDGTRKARAFLRFARGAPVGSPLMHYFALPLTVGIKVLFFCPVPRTARSERSGG
jgi:hypothetical protein